MAHTLTDLLYHIVFSTKHREQSIYPEFRSDLHAYMGGIINQLGGIPLKINGTEDHVHILANLPARVALADGIRTIKSNSSRWLNEGRRRGDEFGWQTGYSAFTVSHSNRGKVSGYIERQEEHHRKGSFVDELLLLLKKHEIEFDERFLLG